METSLRRKGSKDMKDVAVVILNWNGKNWLEKFLPSVVEFSTPTLSEIIIVDNASTDDSVEFLSKNYPGIHQICFNQNYGFTGGYNRALKQVNNPYIVLLNSDVELSPNWLEPLHRLMESDANIAACQPKILSYQAPDYFEYAGAAGGFIDIFGYPFCRGRIFDTIEKDKGQYDDARKVFWATGACMMVRNSVYQSLGGLDENFFAHMEEIDLCWRMQNAGYDIWVEPLSKVYHVGGGTLQSDSPKKTFFNFRNSLLMILKNRPFLWAYLFIFIRLGLDGIAGMKFLLQGQWKHLIAILKAHFSFYRLQFKYWFKRGEIRRQSLMYKGSIVFDYFIRKKTTFK